MISTELIARAISELACIDGVEFDAKSLVQDVVGVAMAFPSPDDFEAAMAATHRMLKLVVDGSVNVSHLIDDYEGWECCHYQHRVLQGAKANMRIMFQRTSSMVRVRGFGNRRQPEDFYRRMAEIGRMD